MKYKKAYLLLDEVGIKSPIPIEFPDGFLQMCLVFKTKKSALKFGKNIIEVMITEEKNI